MARFECVLLALTAPLLLLSGRSRVVRGQMVFIDHRPASN